MEVLDIHNALKALNFKGSWINNHELRTNFTQGLKNPDFIELIIWLTNELHILRKTEEKINCDENELQEFSMELSTMLKELGCPYVKLLTGNLEERFNNADNVMLLLDFLISELMATKIVLNSHTDVISNNIQNESCPENVLQQLIHDLQIQYKPTQNTHDTFEEILAATTQEMNKLEDGVLSEPLMNMQTELKEDEWKQLTDLQSQLEDEYNIRRKMILQRLYVTIKTFELKEKRKVGVSKMIKQKIQELNNFHSAGKKTDIVALLSARKDLAIIEKTSSANVRKKISSNIYKHVIGNVPDRGGRTDENEPPPNEISTGKGNFEKQTRKKKDIEGEVKVGEGNKTIKPGQTRYYRGGKH